ncbi:MAG TPA: glycosyltransferase family 4 protein [Puia sp.]|nr:glycosyltransferase family 4 protein [Puia sp.]
MKKDFSIHVLTTDTDHGETTPYEGVTAGQWTNALHPDIRVFYLRKAGLTRTGLREQIEAVKPDFVYLNHLFSPLFVVYPLWLAYTGRLRSQVVICPRGALYDSALAVKTWKKTPFLRLFRWMGLHRRVLFHATNERERAAILEYFPGSRVVIADNLPRMDQPAFVSQPKKGGAVRFIFVARLVSIKNLLFFLRVLEGVRSAVELTVVGPIEDKGYWEECRAQITRLPANISVSYLGPRRNDELMPLLQGHHIFVLPTTGENFGHSIFEALLAGRPVLISDQTPWLGLTAKKAGWDLPLTEPGAFARVVEETASWDQELFDEWARSAWEYARQFIENPELQRQYIQLFA